MSNLVDPSGRLITSGNQKEELSDEELMDVAEQAWAEAKVSSDAIPLQDLLEEMYHEYLTSVNANLYPQGFSFEHFMKDAEKTIVARLDRRVSVQKDNSIPAEAYLEDIVDEMELAPGVFEAPSDEDREFQEFALRRALEAIRGFRNGSLTIQELAGSPLIMPGDDKKGLILPS